MAKKDNFNTNPGPLKRFEPKTKPLPKHRLNIGLTIALATILTVGVLQMAGVIDISGVLNPDSPKYLNFPSILHPAATPSPEPSTVEKQESWWAQFLSLFIKESQFCPKKSSEMRTPCCRTGAGTNFAQTAAVEVPASCGNCPSDTTYLRPAPHDAEFTAKYGLYWICECNPCPK